MIVFEMKFINILCPPPPPQSLNNAHKGWVSGMAICGDVLLSCCRSGVVRFWNMRNCDPLAEMKTDSPINAIAISDQRVFTASK